MGGSILETKEKQRRKSSHTLVIKTSEDLPFIKTEKIYDGRNGCSCYLQLGWVWTPSVVDLHLFFVLSWRFFSCECWFRSVFPRVAQSFLIQQRQQRNSADLSYRYLAARYRFTNWLRLSSFKHCFCIVKVTFWISNKTMRIFRNFPYHALAKRVRKDLVFAIWRVENFFQHNTSAIDRYSVFDSVFTTYNWFEKSENISSILNLILLYAIYENVKIQGNNCRPVLTLVSFQQHS